MTSLPLVLASITRIIVCHTRVDVNHILLHLWTWREEWRSGCLSDRRSERILQSSGRSSTDILLFLMFRVSNVNPSDPNKYLGGCSSLIEIPPIFFHCLTLKFYVTSITVPYQKLTWRVYQHGFSGFVAVVVDLILPTLSSLTTLTSTTRLQVPSITRLQVLAR